MTRPPPRGVDESVMVNRQRIQSRHDRQIRCSNERTPPSAETCYLGSTCKATNLSPALFWLTWTEIWLAMYLRLNLTCTLARSQNFGLSRNQIRCHCFWLRQSLMAIYYFVSILGLLFCYVSISCVDFETIFWPMWISVKMSCEWAHLDTWHAQNGQCASQ